MIEKGKKSALYTKYLALLSPYLAVFVGLYYFRSGWVAIGTYYAGITAAILLHDPKSVVRQFVQGFRIKWAICSIVICLGIYPLILRFWSVAKLAKVDIQSLLQTYGLSNYSAVGFVLIAILFNPLLEEGFWRGLFRPNSHRPSIIDILFAAYHFFVLILAIHWVFALVGTIILTCFSWAMRAIRFRLGGLAVPALAHLAADVGIISAIVLLLRHA